MPNLIGTAPNQVPTNGSLGNMAFQNKEAVSVDTLVTTALTVTGTGALTVGGTQIVKDASGNVGIGTSSPSVKLEVNGAIRLTGDNQIQFGDFSTRIERATNYIKAVSLNGFVFETFNGTAWGGRMRIDSAGNVGIGTSAPSYALQVETNIPATAGVFVRNNNTGASASGTAFVASSVGNIFIRAHSAAHSVWPNSTLISSDSGFTGGLNILQAGANPIRFWTNSSERMRIDSSGNVGIGTAAPVNYSGYSTLTIQNTNGGVINLRDGGATAQAEIAVTSAETYMAAVSALPLTFKTTNTERMRIDSAGNVGINQTSPAGKLDINGSTVNNIVAVAASAIDCSAGNYFTKTATGALTWTVTNVPASRAYSFILELTNGGTGAQTWFSGIKWPGGTAPTLTTSGVDVLGFITDDGGTTWRGVQLMKDSK